MSVEKVPKKISTGPFNEEEEMLPQLGVPAAAASLCGPVGRLGHLNCRHSIPPLHFFNTLLENSCWPRLDIVGPLVKVAGCENVPFFLAFCPSFGMHCKQIRQYLHVSCIILLLDWGFNPLNTYV